MEPLDVRVFLIAGPSDPNLELRQKLEPEAQKILKYRLNEEGTTYPFSVLLSTLTAWLVTGLGRKVRFEVEVVGEVKGKVPGRFLQRRKPQRPEVRVPGCRRPLG